MNSTTGSTPADPPHEPAPPATGGAELVAGALVRMKLARSTEQVELQAMSGGVSSDIFLATVGERRYCVKRALPRLRVKADWQAPVERNRFEIDYLRTASRIAPESFPAIAGTDDTAGCFAMHYFPPEKFPVWKQQLRDGVVETHTARRVGELLVRIHAATADSPALALAFPTDDIFHALRLGAYLEAAAAANPAQAEALAGLVATTRSTKRVLVHGDYSPKNILVGPDCPVVLDAECAWYGDPAFDLAFVLTHLMLKAVWRPHWRPRYLACVGTLSRAYLDGVGWEPREALESRVARLLPGLMLARIDGKSPVEYIVDAAAKSGVRRFAQRFLDHPAQRLFELSTAWQYQAEHS